MKTVVYQSFRTQNVPHYISRCMETVRQWAGARGFEYRFIDDRLFGYAPDWYREKVDNDKCLVSDLARLELAREFLTGGFDRAVWVDADVVVFAPDRFNVDVTDGFAFCKEVWVERKKGWFKPPRTKQTVNNSVSVFCNGNDFLGQYIKMCKSIVRDNDAVSHIEVGTKLLTRLHNERPISLIQDVGLFSPPVMEDIATSRTAYLRAFANKFKTHVHAANLCNYFLGKKAVKTAMTESVYDLVVSRLLETRGEVVNRFMK